MTIAYCRDDPVSARWSGLNRLLTEYEVDYNVYQHETRIATLEANYTLTVSIASITQPSAATLLVTMTDASTQGPFALPTATFTDRGTWLTSTAYLVNDTFTANGALYRVLFNHTSDPTSFSPTANDGAGHDYYAAMLSSPGNVLPTGGAAGMMLRKSSGTDYAVSWAYPLPTGGTTSQVLAKLSNTSQDANWITLSAMNVSFSPSTGSVLISTNVADAIEEVATAVHSVALASLTDVQYATGEPATGAFIYFNGTKWVPTAAPSADDLISFNGTAWVPGALSVIQRRNATLTALGTTGTVSLDPSLGDVFTITPTGGVTLNAVSAPAGAEITVIVTTSGTSSFNITPSTNFKSQGALATGTVTAKTFAIKFVGNGTNLVEVSRTTAM